MEGEEPVHVAGRLVQGQEQRDRHSARAYPSSSSCRLRDGHAVEVAPKPDDVRFAHARRCRRSRSACPSPPSLDTARFTQCIAQPRVHAQRTGRQPLLEQRVVDDEREEALGAPPALLGAERGNVLAERLVSPRPPGTLVLPLFEPIGTGNAGRRRDASCAAPASGGSTTVCDPKLIVIAGSAR